jgi:accessory gene regulator B
MEMENNLKNQINLIDRIADSITFKVNTYLNKEGLELEKMKLGFEIVLINVSKLIIIMTIAAMLNLVKETLFMILVFGCIRKRAFGIHAKSSIMCTITCIMMFDFGAYFSNYLKINNCIVCIAFTIINILLYKYAPADTEYHPLLGAKLRTKLKREAVLTGIVLMLIALIIPSNVVKTLITLAAVLATIMILPITYKILKRGYDNYEQYEREIA